jgi:hypothetical protein
MRGGVVGLPESAPMYVGDLVVTEQLFYLPAIVTTMRFPDNTVTYQYREAPIMMPVGFPSDTGAPVSPDTLRNRRRRNRRRHYRVNESITGSD